ncbi:MAG: Crp/Fnr family transcriptional regulator [Terracidiphilus sp.]|nr:Crp/Fnr family transcriptional regulator [Terracidiphilus sp.]
MKLDSSAFVADSELLAVLERHSQTVVCTEDRVLFLQGESPAGLYILRSGTATLSMTSITGEQLVNTEVSAGSLLGLPGVIGNQPYTLTGKAAKGTELGFVTLEDFSKLMLENPSLSLRVLRVLAAEVRTARTAITGS